MIVRIYQTEQAGSREVGRLCLDRAGIRIEPATVEDHAILEHILNEPLLLDVEGVPVQIRADQEPRRFLEHLCREYSGSYLRASRPEEGGQNG